MSPINISSKEQFSSLLGEYEFLVADFYADWCGPCKVIAPAYEQLAQNLSSPGHMAFTKVNVDEQQDIAKAYGITAMPTFIVFQKGRSLSTVRGADPRKLNEVVRKLGSEADKAKTVRGGESSGKTESSNDRWLGAPIPQKQSDISNKYDPTGLELLNCGKEYGDPKVLFNTSEPSALSSASKGKGKGDADDWVESETDEQLMLYVPFMSGLRIGMLQLTSLPPSSEDGATRPKTIRLYANRSQILGFEEAEETISVKEVTIQPEDYDAKTGTASVKLRYVDFPNVTSLVFYFVDSYGTTDKLRVDRIRILGEVGDTRDKGPLEKIGDETGE